MSSRLAMWMAGAWTAALMPTVAWAADPAHGEDAAHGGEAASPNLFAGTPWQAIAAVVSFVILLLVLKKYAWGPILQGLQDREAKIKGDLEQAEAAKRDADAALQQYRQQLAEAQKESQRLIDQSRTEAQKLAAQIKDQTQTELTQMKERAQAEIRSATEQAVSELYEQTAMLATQVAGKILQREISPDDQRELVQRSLAEFSGAGRQN